MKSLQSQFTSDSARSPARWGSTRSAHTVWSLLAAWGVVVMLTFPQAAYAQWNEVSKARNGDMWMVDASTARRVGDSARVWVLINHPMPVTNPPPYSYSGVRSMRALVQLDCREQRARRLEASFFSQPGAEGRLLGSSENEDWINVPPDTPDSDLLKIACELPDQATAAPPAPPAAAPGATPAARANPAPPARRP
jgi:hypothetical protein